MKLKEKIPTSKQLAPVYSVVVVTIYFWSILRFFWRLPSLLYSSTAGEIAVIYAYLTVINFFESVTLLLIPVFFSIALPKRWFFDRFVTKGSLLVSLGLCYLAYIASHISAETPFPYELIRWSPVAAGFILILVFFLDQIGFLGRAITELTDRLTVFLFISIPLSVISLLVVLVRNIF